MHGVVTTRWFCLQLLLFLFAAATLQGHETSETASQHLQNHHRLRHQRHHNLHRGHHRHQADDDSTSFDTMRQVADGGDPCPSADMYQSDIVEDDWTRIVLEHESSSERRKRHSLGYTYKVQEGSHVRHRRGATALESRIWTDGIIPYTISESFSNETQSRIFEAMHKWEENTCLKFVTWTGEWDHIHFYRGNRCCSYVGRVGGGRQLVSLGNGCTSYGTILHELGHVIGFWHEQSRPDRDEYVDIYDENIWSHGMYNFNKHSKSKVNSLAQPYDYNSVMHYGTKYYSKNGRHTMKPKDEDAYIGQRLELSDMDIRQTNLLYNCHRVSECGGTIFATEGNIMSPKYPDVYPSNITCEWTISVKKSYTVTLKFKHFDLSACRQILTDKTGTIQSLNYPLSFPHDTDCLWQISVPDGFIITMAIDDLLIPESTNDVLGCRHHLTIIDGDSNLSDVITKLCQSQRNVGLATSGPHLRLRLHSGKPDNGSMALLMRFSASYESRDIDECRINQGGCEQACLNLIGTYACGCRWGYRVAENNRNCTDINECEQDNGGCSHICNNLDGAYVCECQEGYYMAHDQKNCIDENECDDEENNGCDHRCSNTLGAYQCSCYPGYLLATDQKSCLMIDGCGGHFTALETTMKSPIMPQDNNNTIDCVWSIDAEDDMSISIGLDIIDWPEDNGDCPDFISIRQGHGPDGGYIHICKPSDWPGDHNTHSQVVWFHFHSEWPHNGNFTIHYETDELQSVGSQCGGVFNGTTGTLESPGFPNYYPNKVDCIWKITGKTIKLRFEVFDLENQENCRFDFLDISDGKETSLGRFCGDKTPPTVLTSTTGELWITFQSDASVQGQGFRALVEVEL
ncbi:bone morphogenetic protein 1 homolog isoform X2 [Glandiceps talaboti]